MGLYLGKEEGLPDGLELEIRRESILIISNKCDTFWTGEGGPSCNVEVDKSFLKMVIDYFSKSENKYRLEEH